jgi:hypothetical protein
VASIALSICEQYDCPSTQPSERFYRNGVANWSGGRLRRRATAALIGYADEDEQIACVGTRAARNAPTNAPSIVVLAYIVGIRKCIRIVGWVPLFAVKALKIFLN